MPFENVSIEAVAYELPPIESRRHPLKSKLPTQWSAWAPNRVASGEPPLTRFLAGELALSHHSEKNQWANGKSTTAVMP